MKKASPRKLAFITTVVAIGALVPVAGSGAAIRYLPIDPGGSNALPHVLPADPGGTPALKKAKAKKAKSATKAVLPYLGRH